MTVQDDTHNRQICPTTTGGYLDSGKRGNSDVSAVVVRYVKITVHLSNTHTTI